jgi:hypothetical protein
MDIAEQGKNRRHAARRIQAAGKRNVNSPAKLFKNTLNL